MFRADTDPMSPQQERKRSIQTWVAIGVTATFGTALGAINTWGKTDTTTTATTPSASVGGLRSSAGIEDGPTVAAPPMTTRQS